MSRHSFINSYVACILFVEVDDNGIPLDHDYSPEDFTDSAQAEIIKDCTRFLAVANEYKLLDELDHTQAGHDFWLTRNGCGTGFWDRENIYGEHGAALLTIMSKCFGPVTVVCSDNSLELERG